MAARYGIGKETVARIWQARRIRPWKVETFKLSRPAPHSTASHVSPSPTARPHQRRNPPVTRAPITAPPTARPDDVCPGEPPAASEQQDPVAILRRALWAEIGRQRVFGGEGVAPGADLDGAVAAGGADELLDGPAGAVLDEPGDGQVARAAKTMVR